MEQSQITTFSRTSMTITEANIVSMLIGLATWWYFDNAGFIVGTLMYIIFQNVVKRNE
jgi:hypothetical protein